MSEKAIIVKGLSKKYTIGKKKDGSLRETLTSVFSNKKSGIDFWALKDINLEVAKGDVIGIIGKNGAGKSTLLKLLSQITYPTEGRIEINGRVASLLEVGTGFHPELTGRENIFLNGTILGMTRKEVKTKFNEIVAFSGIEKFIDTPVKRYSSGMYVRLAFSVAAHLEPEILIIDEVLAVGDADFQKKCLGKMRDVAGQGRTVIFVSHDIEAVSSLCTKGVLLHEGKIKAQGDINDIIFEYTNKYQDSYKTWDTNNRPGDDTVKLNSVKLINENLEQISQSNPQDKIGVVVDYEVLLDDAKPVPNFHFFTGTNSLAFVAISEAESLKKGRYQTTTWVPKDTLNNITYRIGVAFTTLKTLTIHLYEREVINLEVSENRIERSSDFGGQIPGVVRPRFIFNTKKID